MKRRNHKKDFYTKLRIKIAKWQKTKAGKKYPYAHYIMAVPDFFHLICRLMTDKSVSAKYKAELGLVLTYFISPIDIIPELIVGPIGFVDDLGLIFFVLNNMINNSSRKVVLRNWAGTGEVLKIIKDGLQNMNKMVGTSTWSRIISAFLRMKFAS